jgi:hypothetical protein
MRWRCQYFLSRQQQKAALLREELRGFSARHYATPSTDSDNTRGPEPSEAHVHAKVHDLSHHPRALQP